MMRVGITGGIGSGKSALTQRLETKGVVVVDADIAARQVVESGQPALADIVQRFGEDVLQDDGSLNRAALRRIVFNDDTAREDLEAITHPRIRQRIEADLNTAAGPYVVLSSPLLLESGQAALVDLTVVVDVPETLQLERTMARDDNEEALVRRIMAAQLPRAERLAKADRVVDNSGSLAELAAQADALHAWLLARATEHLND